MVTPVPNDGKRSTAARGHAETAELNVAPNCILRRRTQHASASLSAFPCGHAPVATAAHDDVVQQGLSPVTSKPATDGHLKTGHSERVI
ncbi:MAG: hypothetical protein DRQ56_06365 [Gammaproteobacteria bacterium]|nr:MAG: hypothetical protein DRQ56_06365 [Gammaproteobacteria bacterium]